MASTFSFDIVSEVDIQEVDNAVNQTSREIEQRYDFRGSNADITLDKANKKVFIKADGEHFVTAAQEAFHAKCVKRGISILALEDGGIENTGGKTVRLTITMKNGLQKDDAKKITSLIRDSKIKVTSQIQDEQVRVTGKSKDELQEIMNLVRNANLPFPTQFTNFK